MSLQEDHDIFPVLFAGEAATTPKLGFELKGEKKEKGGVTERDPMGMENQLPRSKTVCVVNRLLRGK